MVYLLGGHTVGVAHCSLFEDRLYNFQNSGKPDPIMNLVLLEILKSRCPQNATVDNTADLDENPVSAYAVDNSYYQQILLGKEYGGQRTWYEFKFLCSTFDPLFTLFTLGVHL